MRRALLLLCAALGACAGDAEKLAPVGAEPADAGPDAAPPPPPPDAGTLKRAVMTRNPFGGPAGNHLIDGDFELSTAPYAGGQYGWRGFSKDGSQPLDVATETGGLCRSGLRCAVMASKTLHLLRGAAAQGKGNAVSGWARLPAGAPCGMVRPLLIECDTFTVHKPLVAAKKADESGWCSYATTLAEKGSATCVYIDNTLPAGDTALLDAFVLGPDDGTLQPQAAEFWVPDAETTARLTGLRDHVIATLPLGKPPARPRPAP